LSQKSYVTSSPALFNLFDPAGHTRIDFEAAGRSTKLKTASKIYWAF